jgi:type IV pilus assembly protein PilA
VISNIRRTRGFTLIELMIVIAIVAILVALAVPAYQNYTIRAKVSECLAGAAVPKVHISEYRQALGYWPPNAAEASINDSFSVFNSGLSHFCRIHFYNNFEGDFAVWVNSEAIDVSLTGTVIIPVLSPVINASGGTDWFCTQGFTDPENLKFLPATCRAPNIY